MYPRFLLSSALVGVAAVSALPSRRDAYSTSVQAAIEPVIDWNDQLFGMTAQDGTVPDKWHDENGLSNVTLAIVKQFVSQGVAVWKTAGAHLATLAKHVDTTTPNADYLALINALFVPDFDTTWFYRFAADWNSQLNISIAQASAQGNRYDAAWLGAVKAVEKVIPSITRDYEVTTSFFWLPADLENYYYPQMAAHIAAIPWEPVIDYCNGSTCNNGLFTYPAGPCYSTADVGVATSIGVGNAAEGFPWTCQIYTDNACTTPVFIPAQPCTLPPPFTVYCQNTTDWNGTFGANSPSSSTENNSGITSISGGSFKCSSA